VTCCKFPNLQQTPFGATLKIDRTIQREILEFLADAYPDTPRDMSEYLREKYSKVQLIANCVYLEGHSLIKNGYQQTKTNTPQWVNLLPFEITSAGIDFLADDGGLSAILGVLTVKLDASSIKALVLNHIDQTENVSHEERSQLKSLLLTAGDQTMRKLVDMLIETGLKAAPGAGQLIGMLRGLLA
jgi:hypothetical protein